MMKVFFILLLSLLTGCASTRVPIPPGEIPTQDILNAADEQYGHQVLNEFTRQYPLDSDDQRINRVRSIVDRITQAAGVDHNPWHVYVLVDKNFQNAGATRGNYIFVWTGLLDAVQTDGELAIVLSHEIAHVLAKHTAEDPAEEAQAILGGVVGAVAGQVILQQGGLPILSDLAEILVRESLTALLVNPDLQSKELEADQIGLFLMAKAGYDPQEAINFWERMKNASGFSGAPLEFLSSHPSSEDRVIQMQELLSQAKEVYFASTTGSAPIRPSVPPPQSSSSSPWAWNGRSSSPAPTKTPAASQDSWSAVPSPQPSVNSSFSHNRSSSTPGQNKVWMVETARTTVYSDPSNQAVVSGTLVKGTTIIVRSELPIKAPRGIWLEIDNPLRGFVMSADCAPLN